MFSTDETKETLLAWGGAIRDLRIARGDTQAIFAERVGVSIPTLRAMERGEPTIQLGHWMTALQVLDLLGAIREALRSSVNLFDRIPPAAHRRRARRRRT